MKKILAFPFLFLSMCAYAGDETSPTRIESNPEYYGPTAEAPNLPRSSVSGPYQRPFATGTGYFPYPGLGYYPMYYANVPGARHAPLVSEERNEKLTNLISAQTEAINSLYEVVKKLEKRLDNLEGKLP
ncbi:MAG: hypothetical protein KME63_15960 [Candidatus Thiodiazotropha sp. (ex Clathrolucina costata)]|nr:hypothetical protein [Candidatus Thiodiazotropha taylori]MCG7863610.1 hypothetical protein [Candidatus Thiodiazotropha endolucinida]